MKFHFIGILFLLSNNGFGAFSPAHRPYQVEHYTLSFTLDPSQALKVYQGTVEIRGKASNEIDQIELDAEDLTIHQITLGKSTQPLSFETKNNKLSIQLPKPLKKNQAWKLLISYDAKVNTGHSGFFSVTDPDEPERGPLYFTHFEPLSARSFYPCNDEPYDKATTEVIGSVPDGYEVLSNGTRLKDKPFTKNNQKWRRIHWVMQKPHSTYLVALAIGKFAHISDKCNGKEISVWVSSTKIEKAKYALGVTKKSCEFFERYLGVRYPWEKYATVGIPTFVWGGMENTSSTHMNQERTLLNDPNSAFEKKKIVGLAAHELAHQWFGDFVTMKWWDDVWLNESFASLMGTLATQDQFKNEEATIETVTDAWDSYFRQEDGPKSHPIVDKALDSAEEAFDATNYTKGENILRMLAFYIGESKFRKGIQLYLTQYGGTNSTYRDLFSALEKTSGEKLDAFRDSWLLHRGYPVLTYKGTWDKIKSSYHLTVSQRPNHTEDSQIFHFRLPVVFHRKSTPSIDKTVVLQMNQAEVSIDVNLDAEPEWVSLNPGAVVLAKVKQAQFDEPTLVLQAQQDPDPLVRVWANYELAAPLMEGQPLTQLSEKTLLSTLQTDTSPYVRMALLDNFKRIKDRWLPTELGSGLYSLAQNQFTEKPDLTAPLLSDKHGWSEFRSKLLGSLGKVANAQALPLLTKVLKDAKVGLDDLGQAALAVASTGDNSAVEILKAAMDLHSKRGYRYRYMISYAFGAYENPKAAAEIKQIATTAGSDLMGKMDQLIRDNNTLKNSKEWAQFLQEFLLTNTRFGDEVKSRILDTVVEVKSDIIKDMLEKVAKESNSNRIKESSKKILKKNFQS